MKKNYTRNCINYMNKIFVQLILEFLKIGDFNYSFLNKIKNKYCEKYNLKKILNIDLIPVYLDLVKKGIIQHNWDVYKLIKKRNVRNLSGVSVISVLTKPYKCEGDCLFCPTEKISPKSYLSHEPAVQRAILNNWDGYKQVHNRLRSLQITGHNISKNELIIIGGTFSNYTYKYQKKFIKDCFDGFNTYKKISKKIKHTEINEKRFAVFETYDLKNIKISKDLQNAQKINEKSYCKIIGLSLETRPDCINENELKKFREFGCTRVQIGVQSVYDDILKLNNRGHTVNDTIKATKMLKDAGFKIEYHIMPNLYGSDIQKDYKVFEEIFENQAFKPDQLKIYPTVVVEKSHLYKYFNQKKYIPYTKDELVDLLYRVKRNIIPKYVRISRLIRDIPSTYILGGNTTTNLRQLIIEKLKTEGKSCNCIRCREIQDNIFDIKDVKLNIQKFDASDGKEFFLSFDDMKNNKLLGFLRLRIPSYIYDGKSHFIEVLQNCAIVRELHIYGKQIPVGERESKSVQHYNFGFKLLKEAENIVKKEGIKKLAIISGIGVKDYYRKFGYREKGGYMLKVL